MARNHDAAPDRFYRQVMEGESQWPEVAEAKPFVESLLKTTAPYLDADLEQKLQRQFHQCFWEMYLAASLLDAGVELVPRSERSGPDYGPDIQLRAGGWIEAVTVTGGTGPDAVHEGQPGVARTVPDEQMKLRLLSALSEKRRKFEGYQASGLLGDGVPCVVAINGALVPSARLERTVPRIIRAVLEVGNEVFVMDRASGQVTERTHDFQTEIRKQTGDPVSQGSFLDGSSALISASLYSCVDAVNRPRQLGSDFVTIHNPTTQRPMARGLIRKGTEWWVENEELKWHDHRPA